MKQTEIKKEKKEKKEEKAIIRVNTSPVASYNSVYNSLAGTGLLDS